MTRHAVYQHGEMRLPHITLWMVLLLAFAGIAACSLDMPEEREFQAETPKGKTYSTTIHLPEDMGRVNVTGPDGVKRDVPCSSCHTLHSASPHERPTGKEAFHGAIELVHGDIGCVSCHATENRDFLSLANGKRIKFDEVITLCAQCHGPQFRDYTRGSHGGMNGYWDLSSGPRVRNSCIDCHAPHAPAYLSIMPVFKPRDRFLGDSH